MKALVSLMWGFGIVLGYGQLPNIPIIYVNAIAPVKDTLACISFIIAIVLGLKQLRKKR
jgi:hypothetical protein